MCQHHCASAPFNTQSYNRYSYVINNPLSLNDPSGYCYNGPDTVSQMIMDRMLGMLESHHVANVTSAMGFFNRPKTNTNSSGQSGTPQTPQTPQTTNDENGDNSASQTQNTLDKAGGDGNTSGQTNASTAGNSNTAPNGASVSQANGSGREMTWDDVLLPAEWGESGTSEDGVHFDTIVCDVIKCQGTQFGLYVASAGFTLSPNETKIALEAATIVGGLTPSGFLTRQFLRQSVKTSVTKSTDDLLFGQKSVSRTFTSVEKGSTFEFAGQSIADVAKGLRNGSISPNQLPIDYVVINGQKVVVNNRSLTTLRRAGMQACRQLELMM